MKFMALIAAACLSATSTPLYALAPQSAFEKDEQTTLSITSLFEIKESLTQNPTENTDAVSFSYLKLGRSREVEYYSKLLAEKIRKDLGALLEQNPADWVVVSQTGFEIPNAGSLVSQSVAKILGFEHFSLKNNYKMPPSGVLTYANVTTREEREDIMHKNIVVPYPDAIKGKNVILIDDAIVTGAVLKEAIAVLLEAKAAYIAPYTVAHLKRLGNNSFENEVNCKAFKRDGLQCFVGILNDEHSIYTTQLIYYIFELNDAEFQELIKQLTPLARLNLYLYSIGHFTKIRSFIAADPGKLNSLTKRCKEDTGLELQDFAALQSMAANGLFQNFRNNIIGVLKKHNYRVPLEEAKRALGQSFDELRCAL